MMTLTEFEYYCHKVFAERLPVIFDAIRANNEAAAARLMDDLQTDLVMVALETVEICLRGASLLVLACCDMALERDADSLGVPASYFERDRPEETEALMYLHERRCGAPARQFTTVH
jgi:hypothetical protein